MTPIPAASRSASSSRMARASWRAVAASGWSSRTNDHFSMVTGPVSMPLTGSLGERLGVGEPVHGHRGRPGHVAEDDRRAHIAGAVGLDPAQLGHGHPGQLLAEVLDHVVALRLPVDEHVQPQLVLEPDDLGDLGPHALGVAGLVQLAPAAGRPGLADLAGLGERADGGRGQRWQAEPAPLGLLADVIGAGPVQVGLADRVQPRRTAGSRVRPTGGGRPACGGSPPARRRWRRCLRRARGPG